MKLFLPYTQQINTLMDATIFGIGIHRPESNDLYFSGAVEKGEILGSFAFNLMKKKQQQIAFTKQRICN